MPPKETAKKSQPGTTRVRPPISDASLVFIPEDVQEGFFERLETGIDWTLIELASRHHNKKYQENKLPKTTFSEALKTKIHNSIFGGFLNEDSNISMEQQWEILLPIALWENEKFSNEEGNVCFRNANSITDDMEKIIKKAVQLNDRNLLRKEIKMVEVLRVIDAKITELDAGLTEFKNLLCLSLCGNFIEEIDANHIPQTVRSIELQVNCIKSVEKFARHLPYELLYFGLARNLLNDESVEGFSRLPNRLTVLDLSHNDICNLEPLLDVLTHLPCLVSLMLTGNPCTVCAAYARVTLLRLPNLQWLDSRKILDTDRLQEHYEPHPDDLRSTYFSFIVFRVMSAVMPPKTEKGMLSTFHVELEIPLLDSLRRDFLMYHDNESLVESLPPPEDDWDLNLKTQQSNLSKKFTSTSDIQMPSPHESDIYKELTTKNSQEILHYNIFESNRVPWNTIMNFNEPAVKIFCPDLVALRNTFRSALTIRLVYSLSSLGKQVKEKNKSMNALKPPGEQRLVLATIRCNLTQPDWSQPWLNFHWDDSLGTNDALNWDGDLSILQYNQGAAKVTKGKIGDSPLDARQMPPDNLTCHFGFGIDTLRTS